MPYNMTAQDKKEKDIMIGYFVRNGFLPYAEALAATKKFITIYSDPTLTGFMSPNESLIVVNGNIDLPHRAVIVRHEILHRVLNHEDRLLKKLADKEGLDFNKVLKSKPSKIDQMIDDIIDDKKDDADSKTEENEYDKLQRKLHSNKVANYAGDYDISNQGYTYEDLDLLRSLVINGELVKVLLTCDDHPEWVNYSLEQLYDALYQEAQKNPQDFENDEDGEGGGQGGGGGNDDDDDYTIIKGHLGDDGQFYDEEGNLVNGE